MTQRVDCSVHERLVQKTQCIHQLLHGHPDLGRLIDGRLNSSDYVQILSFFLSVYRECEQRRVNLEVWPQFSLKTAIDALDNDLCVWSSASFKAVALPSLDQSQSVLGALYVLHGASIGGRVISKHVEKTLPGAPLSFFGRGLNKSLWTDLLAAIESHRGRPQAIDALIHGATQTFQAFNRPIVVKTVAQP